MIGNIFNLILALLYLIFGAYFIFRFKNKLPYKLTCIVFTLLIFIPHVLMLVEVYYRFGIGWNFIYSLPTANVSPFMFTIVFVVLFLPKSIKNYFYLLMSLLSLGMIIAGIGGAIWYIGWEDYHLAISVEWFTHFMMALFGIYLVLSKNVDFTLKNSLKSSIIIYCVVALMIILNVIFDTSFFGLAFNGDHNIYTYLVIPNPYLSAFVYILGLTCVLISGYWFLKLVIKIDEKLTSKYE